jgi:hypothetical protein
MHHLVLQLLTDRNHDKRKEEDGMDRASEQIWFCKVILRDLRDYDYDDDDVGLVGQ